MKATAAAPETARHEILNRRLAQLALVAISLLAGLIIIEFALSALWSLRDPHRFWRQGNDFIRSQHMSHVATQIRVEPGLSGVSGINRFTTNNLGFRGSDIQRTKPAGEYRVFLLGGSSMECVILDDKDSIDAVLEVSLVADQNRRVEVYNAGKSGDRSDDHVAILSQRIVHLEPNLIVVFAGINDLLVADRNYDYLHEGAREINAWSLAITQMQLGRLLYYTTKQRRLEREASAVFEGAPVRAAVERRKAAPAATRPPRINLRAYENNLRTIAGIAASHHIRLVFMTQQTTWASTVDPTVAAWQWMTLNNGVVFDETQLHLGMEKMNDVMRAVATDLAVPLYDVARQLPKSSSHFYDDVHFNVRGAREAAEGIAATINQPLDE